ncbi:MAG: glycosyltransferase family 2 protein [Vampirovibrio sp.]|nr:glycosyltransferase family 2 protein [Vampirovibrio sp.]
MEYRSQTISVVLVTDNNVTTVERALESVKWVDEIIVVDRGSHDGTLEIVRKFTKKVFYHPSEDQAVLRNFGFSKVKKYDWVFCLDPWEWMEEMLKHEIDGILLNTACKHDGFWIPRNLYFRGQALEHGGLAPRKVVRLFKRGKGSAVDHVDEVDVEIDGKTGSLDRTIATEPDAEVQALMDGTSKRSIRRAYAELEAGGSKSSTNKFRMSSTGLVFWPMWIFFHHYILKMGVLDGFNGLLLAICRCNETFQTYAKMRLLLKPKFN